MAAGAAEYIREPDNVEGSPGLPVLLDEDNVVTMHYRGPIDTAHQGIPITWDQGCALHGHRMEQGARIPIYIDMDADETYFGYTAPRTTWFIEDNTLRESFCDRLVYITIDLMVEETVEPDAWGGVTVLHVVFRTCERGARMLRIKHT